MLRALDTAALAFCAMGDWWSYLSIFDPTDPENFEVGLIILATIWFIVSCVICIVAPVLVGIRYVTLSAFLQRCAREQGL